ncbi:MAG: DotD/TraH family lipoprotein [Sulfuritalea sp.]|nr:DotD/TraH family lipoprotein [Sulfuritalea sp.]
MRSDRWLPGTLMCCLLSVSTVSSAFDLPGLRTTKEGTLFRVTSSEDSAPHAAAEYKVVEREQDDAELAGKAANLTIRTPTPMRDVVTLLLADSGLAARFSGVRALEAAMQPVGPALFSGGLRGALNSLAQQAGLQVYIRRNQVEFSDRRGYQVQMPAYENLTEVAARLQATRAANVRIAGGVVEFDADQDGLRDAQNALREIRAGRRGTGTFLAKMARDGKPTVSSAPAADPAAMMRKAEASMVAQMPQATKASPTADPLQRSVDLEFDGDATEGLRRLAQHAGITYKVVAAPKKYLGVSLRLRQIPLRAALESFDAQMKGAAELIYVRSAQRIDFVAH